MAKLTLTKIHSHMIDYNPAESFTDDSKELIYNLMDTINPNQDGHTFNALTQNKYKRAFLVGIMLSILQQLSGINLIIFYSNKVMDINHTSPRALSFSIGVVNFIATLISIYVLRYVGRKTLLLIGML